jgi:hypothetical protein
MLISLTCGPNRLKYIYNARVLWFPPLIPPDALTGRHPTTPHEHDATNDFVRDHDPIEIQRCRSGARRSVLPSVVQHSTPPPPFKLQHLPIAGDPKVLSLPDN